MYTTSLTHTHTSLAHLSPCQVQSDDLPPSEHRRCDAGLYQPVGSGDLELQHLEKVNNHKVNVSGEVKICLGSVCSAVSEFMSLMLINEVNPSLASLNENYIKVIIGFRLQSSRKCVSNVSVQFWTITLGSESVTTIIYQTMSHFTLTQYTSSQDLFIFSTFSYLIFTLIR